MALPQDGNKAIMSFARSLGEGDELKGWARLAALFRRSPDMGVKPAYEMDGRQGWQPVSPDEFIDAAYGRVDDPGCLRVLASIHKWVKIKTEGKITSFYWQGPVEENLDFLKAIAATGQNSALRIGWYTPDNEFQWAGGTIFDRMDLAPGIDPDTGDADPESTFDTAAYGSIDIITEDIYDQTREAPEDIDPAFPYFELSVWDVWDLDPAELDRETELQLDYDEEVPF